MLNARRISSWVHERPNLLHPDIVAPQSCINNPDLKGVPWYDNGQLSNRVHLPVYSKEMYCFKLIAVFVSDVLQN